MTRTRAVAGCCEKLPEKLLHSGRRWLPKGVLLGLLHTDRQLLLHRIASHQQVESPYLFRVLAEHPLGRGACPGIILLVELQDCVLQQRLWRFNGSQHEVDSFTRLRFLVEPQESPVPLRNNRNCSLLILRCLIQEM